MTNPSDERAMLQEEIAYWLRRWRNGQRAFSFAHHSSLFGAALLSLAIGLIVQMKSPAPDPNISTMLSFAAAALSATAAAGGFERKWRANRLSRGRLDELRIDFMNPKADLEKVREKLKAIIKMHDQEILGGAVTPFSASTNASG